MPGECDCEGNVIDDVACAEVLASWRAIAIVKQRLTSVGLRWRRNAMLGMHGCDQPRLRPNCNY